MEAVKNCIPIKKPTARHLKKMILSHLEEALREAEAYAEKTGHENIYKGLERFIANVRGGF